MKPLDVIGGIGGIEDHTDSQLQLRQEVEATEGRIRHQNPNSQNPRADRSLNELLKELGVGDNPSINPTPEKLNQIANREQSRKILERALSDNHAHRLAIEAFSACIDLEEDAINAVINNAVQQTEIVASYGTSGTESNSKEMVNTYQLIQHLQSKSNGKQVTGLYFVADSGHSVYDLVKCLCEFVYPNDPTSQNDFLSGLEPLKPLVGSRTILEENSELHNKLLILINKINNEKLKKGLEDILNNAVREGLTYADLITAWHSFCQFVFLYDMSGTDISQMPIVITCRFSSLIPDSLTVSDLMDMFDNYLPEKKVVLFYLVNQDGEDVPVYNTDFSQEDNDQNDQDGERERKRRVREFLDSRGINESSQIKNLNVGPLSGKTYYLLLQKIAQSYASPNRKSPLVLYLDNYEGPLETEKLIAGIVRRGECAISYVTPGSRFWLTLQPAEHPYAYDRNLAIGAAPPAWMVADLLSRLNQYQIGRLTEFLQEGARRLGSLENGMTVLFIGSDRIVRLGIKDPVAFLYPHFHPDVAPLYNQLGRNQREYLVTHFTAFRDEVIGGIISKSSYADSSQNIQSALQQLLTNLGISPGTELELIGNACSYQECIERISQQISNIDGDIKIKTSAILGLESDIKNPKTGEDEKKSKIDQKKQKTIELNNLVKRRAVLAYLMQLIEDLRPIYSES